MTCESQNIYVYDGEARRIRLKGDAHEAFMGNPKLVLEGCRLASEVGCKIEERTLHAMTSHKMLLLRLEASDVRRELEALLLGDHVYCALMQTIDVLSALMPEIAACKGFNQHSPYHIYDVWEHTAWVVQRSPKTPIARWTALFHDIGKPAACFMDGKRAHFFGHPRLSALLARPILERFEMDPVFARHVILLVEAHDESFDTDNNSIARMFERFEGDADLIRTLCKIKQSDALAHSKRGMGRLAVAQELESAVESYLASKSKG